VTQPTLSLGLRRGTVRLVDHNPDWAILYQVEETRIRDSIDEVVDDIQHVGSTSVPGLRAKPILDIGVAIPSRDAFDELRTRLIDLGYSYRGDNNNHGGWLLARESKVDVRTVNLHVVETSDRQWRYDYIGFRDRLRTDPVTRAAYQRLKEQNAVAFRDDRKAYTAAKESFVRDIITELAEKDER
jgi:GrpB-like predicted nucleotidyltransferase (UPF0157 family)